MYFKAIAPIFFQYIGNIPMYWFEFFGTPCAMFFVHTERVLDGGDKIFFDKHTAQEA
jgi:hypothetical protein